MQGHRKNAPFIFSNVIKALKFEKNWMRVAESIPALQALGSRRCYPRTPYPALGAANSIYCCAKGHNRFWWPPGKTRLGRAKFPCLPIVDNILPWGWRSRRKLVGALPSISASMAEKSALPQPNDRAVGVALRAAHGFGITRVDAQPAQAGSCASARKGSRASRIFSASFHRNRRAALGAG